MAAAENGSVPIVTALVKVGAEVNAKRYDGLTALMAGCSQNSPALSEGLLGQARRGASRSGEARVRGAADTAQREPAGVIACRM